jgi:hypothetical protein
MGKEIGQAGNRNELQAAVRGLEARGFDLKAISALVCQRALWRRRLEKECTSEETRPAGKV